MVSFTMPPKVTVALQGHDSVDFNFPGDKTMLTSFKAWSEAFSTLISSFVNCCIDSVFAEPLFVVVSFLQPANISVIAAIIRNPNRNRFCVFMDLLLGFVIMFRNMFF